MTTKKPERDYVLGTHDEEIERLGLQHRVWRPRVLDAWRRAGFSAGQTLLDVGAGPGYGTLDLAEVAGPTGRVIALERSRRFLEALEENRRRRGLDNIEAREIDLDEGALPDLAADGAWCRWIFAFVRQPKDLLARLSRALRPGAALVIFEYFDYSTWRLAPPTPEIEEFVRLVMDSWRASGGEPDVGLQLPRWLDETGFAVRSIRPIVDIVAPADDIWRWPASFLDVGLRRLVDLGHLDDARSRAIAAAFTAREREPNTFMITPAVLEVVAVRIEPHSSSQKETFMSQIQYKERLLDLARDLGARMARETELGREQTQQGVGDFGDAGVAEEDASADFDETERNSTMLREVQDALQRIEAGTFGLCVVDGQPIEAERLAASPWVPRCLKHQTLLEAEGGQRFPTI